MSKTRSRLLERAIIAALLIALPVVGAPAAAAERRSGGKLLLTDGVTSVDGAAGGGLASWATIAGSDTEDGNGGSAHATFVALPDFSLTTAGAAIGLSNRFELSYAYQRFDTRTAGTALGLGRGFTFDQHIVGAKLRLIGDAVWDQDRLLPQIAAGIQYKIADRRAVIHAIGGRETRSADFYVAATKIWLAEGMVFDATARLTKANQFGLLGFGGDRSSRRTLQLEGSIGRLLAANLLVGAEIRTKPSNLGFAREEAAHDLFIAWAVRRHVVVAAAYVDLGSIATFRRQHGLFLSLRTGF